MAGIEPDRRQKLVGILGLEVFGQADVEHERRRGDAEHHAAQRASRSVVKEHSSTHTKATRIDCLMGSSSAKSRLPAGFNSMIVRDNVAAMKGSLAGYR